MKIILITLSYPINNNYGGSSIHAEELVRLLSRRNEVHVVTPGKISTTIIKSSNIYIHTLKCSFLPLLKLPTFLFQVQRNIDDLIDKYKIDIIHSNDVEGCFQLKKKPSVVTIHHLSKRNLSRVSLYSYIRNIPNLLLERIALNNATKIIAVSNLTKDELLSKYANIEKKTKVINMTVNYKKYIHSDKTDESKMNTEQKKLIYLCPGLITEERKGGIILMDVLKILHKRNDYLCLITGKSREGKWDKKLRDKANINGISENIIFTGEVSPQKMIDYYSQCNVVIYPSLFEGYGLPVLEAMAAGKTIIATKTGEAPYFIENMKNGILIEPNNRQELYQAINIVSNDSNLRKKIGASAKKSIREKLSEDQVLGNLEGLYQEIKN